MYTYNEMNLITMARRYKINVIRQGKEYISGVWWLVPVMGPSAVQNLFLPDHVQTNINLVNFLHTITF